ncbi:fatty acyl-CoA reductase wat-like [Rhynchophorus ferrugineus]|uniref:Fatty acyl-CoA reductase n=1 Tax=Rhynchophorus ferrugineus TaxID=354439 RepID=A0A834IR09_RHYFE|nr:hypothetical protein GWI33_021728 [Rhynchophorus ferrugineus]
MIVDRYGYATFESQNNLKNLDSSPYIESNITNIGDINGINNDMDLTPIQKFFDGANIFITGSTGFLGKILVEKLLRSCPTVSTLYLLVRNKKGKSMEERVDEMFDDIIFDKMKKECPKFRHKVVGVGGDCVLPTLGLSIQDKRLLIDEINIVFHVAATVRFDEHIKTATAINIRTPRDLLQLSRQMKNLKSYVHVSTVFANCIKKVIEEKVYPPGIDGEKLIAMADCVPENILAQMTPTLLGDYPNTYTFTKQVAEDLVKREGENLPVTIFRPAIVVSSYKEPCEAWINNMYGPTGVVAGSGMGLIRSLRADGNVNANIVPVDMVVNGMIAAAWGVGESYQKSIKENKTFEMPVYNYETCSKKPITWGEYMENSEKYGLIFPLSKAIWYYSLCLIKYYPVYLVAIFFLHIIPALLTDTVLLCMGRTPRMMRAYKKIHKYLEVISYFAVREWTLKSEGSDRLLEEMTDKDKELFFMDLRKLDWDKFFQSYLIGIRMYLMQDPMDTLERSKKRWNRFYYAHQCLKVVLAIVGLQIAYWLLSSLMKLV